MNQGLTCANKVCRNPGLTTSDAHIEVKAVMPKGIVKLENRLWIKWKRSGLAAFHVHCWKSLLRMAKVRKTSVFTKRQNIDCDASNSVPGMIEAEKIMIIEAAKTAETFDSLEDIKKAAENAAVLILRARHCIAFTGAGISTSAGLGDFRGKSGKWTEEDSHIVGNVISEKFEMDMQTADSCSSSATDNASNMKHAVSGRSVQDPPNVIDTSAKSLLCITDEANLSDSKSNLSPNKLAVRKRSSKSDLLRSTLGMEEAGGSTSMSTDHDPSISGFFSPHAADSIHNICDEKSGSDTTLLTMDPDTDEQPLAKRLRSQKQASLMSLKEESDCVDDYNEDQQETVDYENLRPTYTHEALSLMLERQLLCFIISQNCDGLHLLSGVHPQRLCELHGNVFVEKCPLCRTRYTRSFYVLNDEASQYYEDLEDHGRSDVTKPMFAVQCKLCGLSHRTGRRCELKGCRGFLEDTIINFRDNLEECILDRAFDEAGLSDLILCLGTTLTVTPACDIVGEAKGQKPLIICNRQKTKKDHLAKVRVFGDCDVFIQEVLKCLIGEEDKNEWEAKSEERTQQYSAQRKVVPVRKRSRLGSVDSLRKSSSIEKDERLYSRKSSRSSE